MHFLRERVVAHARHDAPGRGARNGMLENPMPTFRARVRNGRLVLDEPTDLPEGSILDLVVADSWDALDDADRQALHEALDRSAEDFAHGRTVAAEDVMKGLRERG
jgi:hypothetical protein